MRLRILWRHADRRPGFVLALGWLAQLRKDSSQRQPCVDKSWLRFQSCAQVLFGGDRFALLRKYPSERTLGGSIRRRELHGAFKLFARRCNVTFLKSLFTAL